MYTSNYAGPAADFSAMGSPDLTAEAKSLDNLISNLEVEAFRHASSGSTQRSLEATRKSKELRHRRAQVLQALHVNNMAGMFGDFGAAPKAQAGTRLSPAQKQKLKIEAFTKKNAAEKKIFAIQKNLMAIARKITVAKASTKDPSVSPALIKNAYIEMSRGGRDFVAASGALAVIESGNPNNRAPTEAAAVKKLITQHTNFTATLPFPLPKAQKEAFSSGGYTYSSTLKGMGTFAASAAKKKSILATSPSCSAVVRKIAARPKRKVAPFQLRSPKKQIALAKGARIPPPLVLRALARRIAQRHPRPKDMREELYGDFILEMTKRAAIYAANEQAKGVDSNTAIATATEIVVTQDATAVVEEVTTGVTAQAGEQAASAAVAAASEQILQGAADTGALPSVPAATATDQAQVEDVATSADPTAEDAFEASPDVSAAAVVTDAIIEQASTATPAFTQSEDSPNLSVTNVVVVEGDVVVPFYKRPTVLLLGALALVGGYMLLRNQDKSGEVPGTPTPDAD